MFDREGQPMRKSWPTCVGREMKNTARATTGGKVPGAAVNLSHGAARQGRGHYRGHCGPRGQPELHPGSNRTPTEDFKRSTGKGRVVLLADHCSAGSEH